MKLFKGCHVFGPEPLCAILRLDVLEGGFDKVKGLCICRSGQNRC
jgi:hypothetical protein